MHEFSIACEVWASVARAAHAHHAARVTAVSLEIGALNLLAREQLTFWLDALADRDGSPGLQVRIALVPGRVRCARCAAETDVAAPDEADHYLPLLLACPVCSSPDVEVTGGRELRVVSAEVELAPHDATPPGVA